MSTSAETAQKKRGRPRSFAENSTVRVSVSIETRQKEWLDKIAASSPQESVSNIVRQALDLWHAVNLEGATLVGAAEAPSTWNSLDDDFDYSWQ